MVRTIPHLPALEPARFDNGHKFERRVLGFNKIAKATEHWKRGLLIHDELTAITLSEVGSMLSCGAVNSEEAHDIVTSLYHRNET